MNYNFGFSYDSLVCRVFGSRIRVWGLGFRVKGLYFRYKGLGFKA